MFIDFLVETFKANQKAEAMVWKNQTYSYEWLLNRTHYWLTALKENKIAKSGMVAIMEADFSPNAVALMLGLIELGCIITPLTKSSAQKREEYIAIAKGQVLFQLDDEDELRVSALPYGGAEALFNELRSREHPGLILFSSGSTGKSKAVVHDLHKLMERHRTKRVPHRMLAFLLFDHIGGLNTLLYCLSNGGCLVTVQDRTPDAVCHAVQDYKVDVLPVSPTFLNLLLLHETYCKYDLGSLKAITYGTELMPETTLTKLAHTFPQVKLQQTYGLTELGILRSKSEKSDSLWVKIGGEGYNTRVKDGVLQIKADSATLGYLNAPSPFTDDGWYNTGDAVEVKGDYVKFLGRKSELINVGGEKVYPGEVESVIQEMETVADVTVYGEKNLIMGNIVCAKITLKEDQTEEDFTARLRAHCLNRLQKYKIPIKILFTQENLFTDRFKKKRALQ